jgi:hypothetical protein
MTPGARRKRQLSCRGDRRLGTDRRLEHLETLDEDHRARAWLLPDTSRSGWSARRWRPNTCCWCRPRRRWRDAETSRSRSLGQLVRRGRRGGRPRGVGGCARSTARVSRAPRVSRRPSDRQRVAPGGSHLLGRGFLEGALELRLRLGGRCDQRYVGAVASGRSAIARSMLAGRRRDQHRLAGERASMPRLIADSLKRPPARAPPGRPRPSAARRGCWSPAARRTPMRAGRSRSPAGPAGARS